MYRFIECTAGQYMTRDVTTVTRDVTLRDLEALFEKHDFNSFPVVEEGQMLGIVTKFDFLRAFAFTTGQMVPHYDDVMKRPVAEVSGARRTDGAVDPSSPVDGEPEGLQLSRYRRRAPTGGHHLSRGCDAGPQRRHTGSALRLPIRRVAASNRWDPRVAPGGSA